MNDEQRRILEHSKVTLKEGEKPVSGKALWDALGNQDNGEALQNAFVNLTNRLASVTFADGTNALSQVNGISAFAPDRMFADVGPSLLSDLKASDQFTAVGAGMHKGFRANSFKDWGVPLGNIQFSFAEGGGRADIDIDIGNVTNGLFGALVHLGEVVQNKVFKTTTSQDTVRKLLLRNPNVQTITPSTDPKWNRK